MGYVFGAEEIISTAVKSDMIKPMIGVGIVYGNGTVLSALW